MTEENSNEPVWNLVQSLSTEKQEQIKSDPKKIKRQVL